MSEPPCEAWIVPAADTSPLRLWGLSATERLGRSLERAGCTPVRVLAPGEAPAASTAPGSGVLLARADWIYDERLITALRGARGTWLRSDGDAPVAVAAHVAGADAAEALDALGAPAEPHAVGPAELAPSYDARLRKSEPPFLLPAAAGALSELERHTFGASYKGATDLVTKWLWPAPARAATRRLADWRVHPNTVTIASWVLAIAAFALFEAGAFGAGLVVAWAMTFLDTVDGKLARVTLTSSRLGDVLDHGLDLVHPPFWWWAWGAGLGWADHPATWIVVGGYFAGRALEGAFLAAFGMETHSWRPIDGLFRTITARRNPNLLLLTVATLGGRPELGLVMVALWTGISLAFHAVRLGQAWLRRRGGLPVEPWDAPPGDPAAGGAPSPGG